MLLLLKVADDQAEEGARVFLQVSFSHIVNNTATCSVLFSFIWAQVMELHFGGEFTLEIMEDLMVSDFAVGPNKQTNQLQGITYLGWMAITSESYS